LYAVTHTHAHTHTRTHAHTQTHTHTTVLQPSWILSGITWVSCHQKGKTRKINQYDLLELQTVSGSGISWAIMLRTWHTCM